MPVTLKERKSERIEVRLLPSFLPASLQNFLVTAKRHERPIKRGGLCAFISLDAEAVESRYQLEPVDDSGLTAEQIFDARWALTLLNEAMASVQAQYGARSKGKIFETLKGFLLAGNTGRNFSRDAAATLGVRFGNTKPLQRKSRTLQLSVDFLSCFSDVHQAARQRLEKILENF
jgi:hypothetical protein